MFKIISGGQTGADRAALNAASNMGVATGGWAPVNYMTENGPDPSLAGLGLKEATEGGTSPHEGTDYKDAYKYRTVMNVEESDGTVLFGRASPGYNLTQMCCRRADMPLLSVSFPGKAPNPNRAAQRIFDWIIEHNLRTINVAGNRESKNSGIYEYVFQTMIQVCQKLKEHEGVSRR